MPTPKKKDPSTLKYQGKREMTQSYHQGQDCPLLGLLTYPQGLTYQNVQCLWPWDLMTEGEGILLWIIMPCDAVFGQLLQLSSF